MDSTPNSSNKQEPTDDELVSHASHSLNPSDISVPLWHAEVLASREAAIREGTDSFVDWEAAKEQLQGPIKVEMKLPDESQWDDDETPSNEIVLPELIVHEIQRRRNEMLAEPQIGVSHEETWHDIFNRDRQQS